jgi:hypothetical protein
MAFPGGGLVRGVDSFAPQPFVQHVHLLLPRANNANARKQHKRNCARATTSSLHDGAVEPTGSRYICLLEDYEKVRGAYFYALFDQLFELTGLEEKRIAFLTTQKDLDGLSCHIQGMDDRNENDDGDDEKGGNDNGNDNGTTAEALEALLETLESSLELETAPEVFVLDDWNPLAVEERFSAVGTGTATSDGDGGNDKDPTILWLYGNHNAFYTRHLLRTSGFDRYIQERSASSSCGDENENERHTDDNNCVFVGEGTGAACAWITMDAARARGDDPRGAPELQAFGLKLLGNDENGNSKAIATSEGVGFGVVFAKKALSISDDSPGIEVCGEDEVFVWAQPPQELSFSAEEEQQQQHVATNFIMAPNRRGTIERYTTLDPLPPLVVRKEQQSSEGVACYGEPSVDPSRSMQAGTIGDSEWCE